MARTASRPTTARRNMNNARSTRGIYVEGNTARKLQEIPRRNYYPAQQPVRRRRPEQRRSAEAVRRPQQLSQAAIRNRQKAQGMTFGFVLFLAVVSAAILFFSIHYLQLKSEITASMKTVANLESELTQLREDNDAYESQVTSNIDLTRIKKIAIGRLDMKYPSEEQTMTYETAGSSYVRQYQDIPDSK